jgi:hypothetical protein
MILQDDGRLRSECSQGKHVTRKAEAMNVKQIRLDRAQQFAECSIPTNHSLPLAEGQKMVVDSAAHEVLGVDTRLDYRDANAG